MVQIADAAIPRTVLQHRREQRSITASRRPAGPLFSRRQLAAFLRRLCCAGYVRFSNRPFRVKRFQTIHHYSVDVAHGLALLFGIGTRGPSIMGFEDEVEQSFGRPCRQFERQVQADMRTYFIHRPARGHLSTAGWISSFLLSALILNGFHAAVAATSRVHRNSVPSIHMRCMMTASRRARATIAFFIPRRLAICMAQALSQDHFFECNMLCAAS